PRPATVVEMIEDRRDLAKAIPLNSSMFNGARLIGPSIGGVLIALVGEGACFLIDGISYIAVIASLLAMKLRPAAPRSAPKHVVQELREGFRYAASSQPIRVMLGLLGVVSLVGMPFSVLMPLIASVRLHGGANTVLQTILEERMRGRVMAFYTMAVMGTAPFGALIAGVLADRIGAPWTIAGGGVVCAGAAGYCAAQLPRLREQVRPIYQKLGIL